MLPAIQRTGMTDVEATLCESRKVGKHPALAAPYGRAPGIDPKTGEYSTAQMLYDEFYGGDTSQPLFD